MKKTKRNIMGAFGFWKFLIMLSIVLNVLNFYFMSGLYSELTNDFNVPLSNTASGVMTGYFVFGYSSLVALIILFFIGSVYFIFRK